MLESKKEADAHQKSNQNDVFSSFILFPFFMAQQSTHPHLRINKFQYDNWID